MSFEQQPPSTAPPQPQTHCCLPGAVVPPLGQLQNLVRAGGDDRGLKQRFLEKKVERSLDELLLTGELSSTIANHVSEEDHGKEKYL